MSMLGLSGEREKDDNLFKRLFWPSNHPNDVDTLGQQGFWICLVVGLSSIAIALTGHPLVALLTVTFYWLGGMGVREHSVTAAILVAFGYVLNIVLNVVFAGVPPGVIAIILTGLLLANIRGTYIASAWKKKGVLEDFPERMNTTFTDKLVDQLPARVWPVGRFVFYVVGTIYILLLVLGSIGLMMRPRVEPVQPIHAELPAPPSR